MAMPDTYSQPTGTLEVLQTQPVHSRRIRPPDLDMDARDQSRVPLRGEVEREREREKEKEKLGRRESKLGLRSIFGRHKTATDVEAPHSYREAPSRGIRDSLAVIGNWPYSLHGAKSEISLPTIHSSSASRPVSTAFVPPPNPVTKSKRTVAARSKTPTPTTRGGRGSLATWDPPPLFQAYPQAIRHAQLPACTASADALLRLHGRKGSDSMELQDDATTEKSKKRHRRNTSASSAKLDWTTKIYVLVTSGYLLQYAGEGSFDRLPEKILQIGKDSAAFASDLIPGKHWVLQVSSAMESDGTQTSDSRSLFSRLPFRAAERRQASTFLMVFESADEMEGWIATLRREIEHLGGKKSLSETGKPKVDDNIVQLRAQPSQRTLVVRDPERFSRVLSTQELPWNADTAVAAPDISLDAPESDDIQDPESLDDVSATNSVVSQDGRQLDNLRDSANRLSFISSGQRTFVTSEGSSPPCSPARDSFASQLTDDVPCAEVFFEARPRPNAAAILDRRQSMQTMNPLVEFRIAPTAPPRPISVYSTTSWQDGPQSPPTIPNFSVPHSAGRRYSLVKSSPPEFASLASPPSGATARIPPGRARRPPPPSLGFSRPLSIVKDQPSPGTTSSPRFSDHFEAPSNEPLTPGADATITPVAFNSMGRPISQVSQNDYEFPARNPGLVQVTIHTSPERRTSLQTLRSPGDASDHQTAVRRFVLSTQAPTPSIPLDTVPGYDENSRCKSSMDSYGRTRSRSPRRHSREALLKRSSMYTQPSEGLVQHSRAAPDPRTANFDPREFLATLRNADGNKLGPLLPRPSASNQHLRVHSNPKALLNRRSMPQLADGPPPAPPPTCALPPLPRKPTAPKSRARAVNT